MTPAEKFTKALNDFLAAKITREELDQELEEYNQWRERTT